MVFFCCPTYAPGLWFSMVIVNPYWIHIIIQNICWTKSSYTLPKNIKKFIYQIYQDGPLIVFSNGDYRAPFLKGLTPLWPWRCNFRAYGSHHGCRHPSPRWTAKDRISFCTRALWMVETCRLRYGKIGNHRIPTIQIIHFEALSFRESIVYLCISVMIGSSWWLSSHLFGSNINQSGNPGIQGSGWKSKKYLKPPPRM